MFNPTRPLVLAMAVVIAACSDRPLTTETSDLATSHAPQFSSMATATVTTAADAGAGSLRQAILDAPGGGATTTINFAPALANAVITLTSGELAIADKRIVIDASPSTVIISGNNASRVFNVAANGTLELTRMIVQGGSAIEGAGIYNAGTVKLTNTNVRQNTSTRNGGGIYTTGQLSALDSDIRENRSTGSAWWPRGGGIYIDGGAATLTNTTIYQNLFSNYSGDGAQIAVVSGALQMKGGQMYGDFVTYQAQNAPGLYVRGTGNATLDSVAVYGFRAAGPVGPLTIASGGSLTLTRSRIGASTVQGEPNGALIHNTGGTVLARYNQFVFPSRMVYHGSGTTDVDDNFWGCNGGPNASGCSQARGVTPATWMVITNTPSPAAIALGGTSTLSIDASKNSAGQPIAAANLAIFAGRSLTFAPISLGTVAPANVTLNASFQATATFTGSSTQNGLGGASARMTTQGMGLYHQSYFHAAIQVGPSNSAPVANAGSDQTVECTGASTSVMLNGSASSDANGDALVYTWKENNVVIASTSQPTVQLGHGTHTITLEVSDGTATSSDVIVINVVDTQAPAVTLNGAASITIELGSSFVDAGASAVDACVGAVAVQTSGSVNGNAVGDYTITYSANDGHGNSASATRLVRVRDTQPPVITLNGSASMTLELGVQAYSEPGASAVDAVNGSIPVQISGAVNSNAVGTYTITYTATDPSGNSASKTRTVHVRDTQAPVITVSAAPMVLWSPNHKYATVAASALGISVSDASGASAQDVVITKVTSDEPDNSLGDGDTPADMVIALDGRSVQLRAERAGNGNGRVYVIHLGVSDSSGNTGSATYRVSVPKNAKQAAVMDAVVNTVLGVNP